MEKKQPPYKHRFGGVDWLDGTYVCTQFICFIVLPLIPVESMLVSDESTSYRYGATVIRYRSNGLRFVPKSIFLGYLRVWCSAGAFLYPCITHWGEVVKASMFRVSGALLLVAIGSLFFGRLSREEKEQRRLLALFTSLPVPPSYLDDRDVTYVFGRLRERATAAGIPESAAACEQWLNGPAASQLELVFAYASYQSGGEWKRVANAAWARLRSARVE